MTPTEREAAELDLVIDLLLREEGGPRVATEAELVRIARLLRETLPRLHPRFSFEELLARRLATAGRPWLRQSLAETAPAPIPLARIPSPRTDRPPDPRTTGPLQGAGGEDGPSERRRRQLVAGGAIASGVSLALPLAGAAIVAWRRSRSSGGVL